jgi:hydrogenase maturation factor HypF (carbamoyltransferase family)
VRNLTDGSVEAIIQGPRDALAKMVSACHAGPPLARVTEVKSDDVEGSENFAAFMNLAFSASRTANVAPYYGDPYKVSTNFNTFNIGIAVRTDTWW